MKISKYLLLIATLFVGSTTYGSTTTFTEQLPVYGVVKPNKITTAIGINHGIVTRIPYDIGDKVQKGGTLLVSIEKETTRYYRTTISGQISKIHVKKGAVVTPGMPLVTVIDPKYKKIEVLLSPQEAQRVKLGQKVYLKNHKLFAKVSKISPLVDPDHGGVTSYISPINKISHLIGDVVPLTIALRDLEDCKVVNIKQIDQFTETYHIEALSGDSACLRPISKQKK